MSVLFSTLFGAATASAYYLFSLPSEPENRRFKNRWHAMKHQKGVNIAKMFGSSIEGQIAHVEANLYGTDQAEKKNVFGLVCHECGFVNVGRVVKEDRNLEVHLAGCPDVHSFWTTKENLDNRPPIK